METQIADPLSLPMHRFGIWADASIRGRVLPRLDDDGRGTIERILTGDTNPEPAFSKKMHSNADEWLAGLDL